MIKHPKPEGGGLFDIESPMAIELRRIMIRLGRQLDLERKRALMITSAERGEGKSLFALHFSLVLAEHLRKEILLLDGDVRRPVQHTVFQVPLSPGFADVLAGDVPAREATRPTKVPNLHCLPAGLGGGNPSRLFSGGRVRDLVRKLQETFDVIVFDSPPVVPVSDPLHYLDAVDGTVFLVMAGQTHRDISQRGVEILRSAGANILGVVANNLGEVLPYYYDRKYYGYSRTR
ncbi:MAG TPA: CpsD/CapB family tyrosine-protein kinase [Candidatus Krumholzibacteria bacterium]|nr:CpsD/CapB family tyrosine-protein kinase [Candidatus Krumholzibacteria bacterium]HPD71405.1 CpsD/CapB family tyrosine-protein kinase [Candidatus Krumholzibacteria bacterium]HRY41662.1 CpsD/CapB family tyrosine-protein kinase [Candidatus Krumholzibacteria bacterium]